MSKLKEQQMEEWRNAIYQHIDSDDSVLRSRAREIKRLIEPTLEVWINCDRAHSRYTGEMPIATLENPVQFGWSELYLPCIHKPGENDES